MTAGWRQRISRGSVDRKSTLALFARRGRNGHICRLAMGMSPEIPETFEGLVAQVRSANNEFKRLEMSSLMRDIELQKPNLDF